MIRHTAFTTFVLLGVLPLNLLAVTTRPAGPTSMPSRIDLARRADRMIDKALRYQFKTRLSDGGWKGFLEGSDPAITALVIKGFIQHDDYGADHPVVRDALKLIYSYKQPDGGFYAPELGYGNYSTSVVLMALSALEDEAPAGHVKSAQNWLKANQWIEGKCDNDGTDITVEHPWYGGAGYGRHRRPDLSNTQMMLEALHQSGLSPEDPAYKKALKFVERCQMLDSTNDLPFADGVSNGGFIYSPANGGETKAGTITVDGHEQLRTYGSITYAGFKSMLYARVDREDPRVQAAWDWIRSHYTLEENPNLPGERSKQGLFYYYHVFAKALHQWDKPLIIDHAGQSHNWREDLISRLENLQQADGHWVNTADRWQEGNPNLVTAYCVLALQEAVNF